VCGGEVGERSEVKMIDVYTGLARLLALVPKKSTAAVRLKGKWNAALVRCGGEVGEGSK
jgi:hypothetical protein